MAKDGEPVQPYKLGLITRELEAISDCELERGCRSYPEDASCQDRARGRCLLDPYGVGDSDWGWHALRELARG